MRSPFSRLVPLLVLLAGCKAVVVKPNQPIGAAACAPDTLPACEDAIARAVAQGDELGPIAEAYVRAREGNDGDDPFAQAVASAKSLATKGKAALAVASGASDRGAPPELQRFAAAPFAPVGKLAPELLWLVLAEAAGLDYVAAVKPDGSVVRAFGRDPLAPWGAGLAPVFVDRDVGVLADDAAMEAALRGLFEKAAAFDYVAAVEKQDVLAALIEKQPSGDGQALRARIAQNALGLPIPEPLVSGTDSADPPPPLEPRPYESPYYDMLRVRLDPKSASAFEKRRARIMAAVPADAAPLLERTWGKIDETCAVTLPGSFDKRRDLAFGYLLPQALLPAEARDVRGRLPFHDWYVRYGKLVGLIERTGSTFFMVNALIAERGGASSIMPSGSDTHRRVNALVLKHAKALLEVAKKDRGRVGAAQLGFLGWPGTAADAETTKTVSELVRVAADGSLDQTRDAWDLLATTFMGAMLATNMPAELREQHLTGLSGAFTSKLKGELSKQTGWPVAMAFAADLAYRTAFGLGPDVSASVTEVTRALESDAGIPAPGLASLTAAFVRYGALGAQNGLGSPVLQEGDAPLPARAAARASLQKALAQLAPGAPDPRVLKELTAFADNVAATATLTIADSVRESLTPPPPPPAKGKTSAATDGVCKATASDKRDPKLGRALSKLADQRRTLLGNKAFLDGKDEWSKRARLLTLLLSDTLDVATAQQAPLSKKKPQDAPGFPTPNATRFFVAEPDAERWVKEGLGSFGVAPRVGDAVNGAYASGRGFLRDGQAFFRGAGLDTARELLAGIGRLLQEDQDTGRAGGLLESLSAALTKELGRGAAFVAVAQGLFEKGKTNEAEAVLLVAVIMTTLSEEPLGNEAFDLADKHKSQMAWVFDFIRYAAPRAEKRPPPRFKKGLDVMLSEKCAVASSDTVTGVIDSLERFRSGDRDKARLDIDRLLEAGRDKLAVPKVSFTFKQETKTRALNLAIAFDLGAPFLGATGDFNVGGGFQTMGEPKFVLEVAVDSADAKRTADSSARYYVHATTIAGVLHFLQNDPKRGEIAAARALGSVLMPTAIYKAGVSDPPESFVEHARPAMAILAQQALESGRPMLAGALLQIVREDFDASTVTADDMEALLDTLPRPLQGIAELDPIVKRAKKTLRTLGGGFPCVGPKSDKAVFMRPTCEAYPGALALRVADSLAALPTLSAGKKSESCPTISALDSFLTSVQSGKYEPDRMIDAAEKLLADKKLFDAAFLLTRQRDPSHCVPRVVGAMRQAFADLDGAPSLRADLLAGIVNCEVGGETSAIAADLGLLDAELRKLGDPSRELRSGLFAAALSAKRGDASLLQGITKQPDFVSRHREHGGLLAFAVMLDQLALALAGAPIDPERNKKDLDLLCGLGDAPAGPELCKMLKQLRQSGLTADDRKRLAEETIQKLSQ